jgi:hypothetical protein
LAVVALVVVVALLAEATAPIACFLQLPRLAVVVVVTQEQAELLVVLVVVLVVVQLTLVEQEQLTKD